MTLTPQPGESLQARIARVMELDKKYQGLLKEHGEDIAFEATAELFADMAPEMASIIRELVGICEIAHKEVGNVITSDEASEESRCEALAAIEKEGV